MKHYTYTLSTNCLNDVLDTRCFILVYALSLNSSNKHICKMEIIIFIIHRYLRML